MAQFILWDKKGTVFILSAAFVSSQVSIFITLLFILSASMWKEKGGRYEWGKLPINKGYPPALVSPAGRRETHRKLNYHTFPTFIGITLLLISPESSSKFIRKKSANSRACARGEEKGGRPYLIIVVEVSSKRESCEMFEDSERISI